MSECSVTHATFVLERAYDASPERVFAAFSDPVAKAKWFVGPDDWESSDHELDFRVGGREHVSGGPKGGPVHTYDAVLQDIVPNERIVSTDDMRLDDRRISVSLATMQLEPVGAGTRVTYTEQGAFLDGFDDPEVREQGNADLLDALGKGLEREVANA